LFRAERKSVLDSRSISKQLESLRAEIGQLRRAALVYRTTHSKHPSQVKEHENRMVRMQQILEELASLMKKDT